MNRGTESEKLSFEKILQIVGRDFVFLNSIRETDNNEFTDIFINTTNDVVFIENKSSDEDFILPKNFKIKNIEKLEKSSVLDVKYRWLGKFDAKINKAKKQLNGVENYFKDGKIILETKKRKDGLYTPIKYNKNAKIHKIIILDGIDSACKQFYDSKYSYMYNKVYAQEDIKDTDPLFLDKQLDSILSFSKSDLENNIHIFPKELFQFIVENAITIMDLINYLNWKENIARHIDIIDEYNLFISWANGLTIEEYIKTHQMNVIGKINFALLTDNGIDDFIEQNKKEKFKIKEFNAFINYIYENTTDDNKHIRKKILEKIELQKSSTKQSFSYFLNQCIEKKQNGYQVYKVDKKLFFLITLPYTTEEESNKEIRKRMLELKYIVYTKYEQFINEVITIALFRSEEGLKPYLNISHKNDYKPSYWKKVKITKTPNFEKNIINVFQENGYKKMKGRNRNEICPCGSGLKYKKCCGK